MITNDKPISRSSGVGRLFMLSGTEMQLWVSPVNHGCAEKAVNSKLKTKDEGGVFLENWG